MEERSILIISVPIYDFGIVNAVIGVEKEINNYIIRNKSEIENPKFDIKLCLVYKINQQL